MINMIDLQDSFILMWAKKLLNSDNANWKTIPMLLLKRIVGYSAFNSNVSSKDFKDLYLLKNDFWSRVLTTWLDCKLKINSFSDSIELDSPLFNNYNIVYKKATLLNSQFCKTDICKVEDIITDNEHMINLKSFKMFAVQGRK